MSGQVFGDYRLVRRLGAGGMGEVHLARLEREEGFSKLLVLKLIRPELSGSERFQKWFAAEARLSASLNHPNIVQVIDFGRREDKFFLVMEYVEGADLARVLEGARARALRPPLGFILAVGLGISRALWFAHGKTPRLVHGDVNPQNVLLGRQGEVKLADFGLAALSNPGAGTGSQVVGKLGYLSPEVAGGKTPSAESDIFGLGAVLYQAACGAPPYPAAESFSAGLAMCRRCEIKPPGSLRPDLHPVLCRVIERSLRPAPEERFSGAAEIEDALTRLASSLGADTGPRAVAELLQTVLDGEEETRDVHGSPRATVSATVVARPAGKKRRLRALLLLASLAVAAAVLVWLGWPTTIAPQAEVTPPAASAQFMVKAPAESGPRPAPAVPEAEPPRPKSVEKPGVDRPPRVEKHAGAERPRTAEPKTEPPVPAPPTPETAAVEKEEIVFSLRAEGKTTLLVDGEAAGEGGFSSREPLSSARVFQLRGADGLEAVLRLDPAIGQKGLVLAVRSKPFAIFSLDGKPRGLTPLAGLSLLPGAHTLTLAPHKGVAMVVHVEFR